MYYVSQLDFNNFINNFLVLQFSYGENSVSVKIRPFIGVIYLFIGESQLFCLNMYNMRCTVTNIERRNRLKEFILAKNNTFHAQ